MNPRALALEIALGWFNSETESFNDLRHKYQDDELLAALALLQRYITDAKKEIKSNPNGSDNRPDVPPSSLYIMGKKVDDLPNDT